MKSFSEQVTLRLRPKGQENVGHQNQMIDSAPHGISPRNIGACHTFQEGAAAQLQPQLPGTAWLPPCVSGRAGAGGFPLGALSELTLTRTLTSSIQGCLA